MTQRATARMCADTCTRSSDRWLVAALRCPNANGCSGYPFGMVRASTAAIVGTSVAMVTWASTTGCGDSWSREDQALYGYDTADVSIVESGLDIDNIHRWSVHDFPDVVIGDRGDEEGPSLYRVQDVRLLSDGRIVAMNGHELIWFDEGGRLIKRAGGHGEGPSEFLSILGMDLVVDDSLIVVSGRPPSIKIFDSNGQFDRAVSVPIPANIVAMYRIRGQGWIGMAFGGEFPPAVTGIFPEIWYVVRYTTDFEYADTLFSLEGRMLYGDRRASVYVPGGPGGYFAFRGDVMIAGESHTYELKVLDDNGELQHVIRNVVPNPTDMELAILSPIDLPVEGAWGERQLQTPTMTAPAYDGVLVASDGMAWVRRRAGPDDTTVRANAPWSSTVSRGDESVWVADGFDGQEWHIYDDSGALIASAVLPARLRPTEITSSKVVGVWKDDLGVETIRVYRLIVL